MSTLGEFGLSPALRKDRLPKTSANWPRFRDCWAIAVIQLVGAGLAVGQPLETDSLDRDYAAQLVRIPPAEPDAALATFRIVDGFRIELVAAEPLVSDPVAIAFDEFGRLFVVEMRGYSEDGADNLGVVRLLEDTDGDGRFDRGTDYLKNLSWPTAIACYDGGVFVGVAPDILYCKDTDRDGVADLVRVAFRGFGRQNVQGLLNSFVWGMDNRLYGSASSNGGTIRIMADPEGATIRLRRQDFAIDPASFELAAVSGGGQHGMSFDRWGDRYVSSNSNHIQLVEFESRYLARNPLLSPTSLCRSIAEDGPAAEVFRASPVEPWRIIRTRLRIKGMVGGPIEGGGRAAGYFTGATGVTIYRGDAFPLPLRQQTLAFVGDVGGNLVHLKRIEANGLSTTARRVHKNREFLTSTDTWFRPVQLANGPDGALYVLDMYREVIEHPLSLPPVIKRHLDLTSGRRRGRIYRIVPEEFEAAPRSLPGEVAGRQLVQMLEHANGWHRETAARLISKRSDQAALRQLLRELVVESQRPEARIRALYCLASRDELDSATLLRGLQDGHSRVREHAIRIAEQHWARMPEVAQRLTLMTNDVDPRVRLQLALSLGELAKSDRVPVLVKISRQGIADSKMRLAVLSAVGEARLEFIKAWLDEDVSKAGAQELLSELVRQVGTSAKGMDIAKVMTWLRDSGSPRIRRLVATLLQATGKRGSELVSMLGESGVRDAEALLRQRIEESCRVALTDDADLQDRVAAVNELQLAEFSAVAETLERLLAAQHPPQLRRMVVAVLGTFSETDAGNLLLNAAPSLSPEQRRRALDLVCARPQWRELLVTRMEQGEIGALELSAVHRQRLLQDPDRSLQERAQGVFGVLRRRADVVKEFESVLAMNGNADRGGELFRKSCATCHKLDGAGHHVGPDLRPLRNRGAAFMLTNILDPNREVDSRYVSYVVTTQDGRSLTGIVVSESEAAIQLSRAEGQTDVVRRAEIEEIRATGVSLMPEGLEREVDHQAMADLIAYLISRE